jgi:hypothetical protein
METSLVEIVEESGIDKSQVEIIIGHFSTFLESAKGFEARAKAINVTSIADKKGMRDARELRLEMKEIRVEAEKKRKALNEKGLRERNAINGVANVIKALIIPIEQYLEQQEKFAEEQERKDKEAKLQRRIDDLAPLVEDINMYNLADMSDEVFDKLLTSSKLAHEQQIQAKQIAEEERIAKEKAEREENERIRIENEKLLKEKAEAERVEKEKEEKRQAELAEERAIAQAKVEAEEKKRKEAEEKLEEIRREEEKAKEKAEAEKKALEEKARQEALAPEKDKLMAYIEQIKSLSAPKGLSKAGDGIVSAAEEMLLAVTHFIKEEMKNL